MKKILTVIMCCSFLCLSVFSIAASAGVGSDSGYLNGTTLYSRCSTGTSTAIPSYYASSEASTKKNLRIDISVRFSGTSSDYYDSTGQIYDYATSIADDSVPVSYMGSTHFVGDQYEFLFADAR